MNKIESNHDLLQGVKRVRRRNKTAERWAVALLRTSSYSAIFCAVSSREIGLLEVLNSMDAALVSHKLSTLRHR